MIGCGTVGQGVAKLLLDQAQLYQQRIGRPIQLHHVLVRDAGKDRGDDRLKPLLTTDADVLLNDDRVSVVVEVAGGIDQAGQHVRRALQAGRHVVTANKSLLAAEGPELFAMAREHGVSIAFEASCGGGIPCVTALAGGLMANRIDGLYGILNGTCNFILSAMSDAGRDYDDVLAEAQRLGFAEADPTLDVSGADAAQKLAILASLAFGCRFAEADIPAQGIDGLALEDVRYGAELGYVCKLLATAERWPGQPWIAAGVQPCFLDADQPLAKVGGAFNALSVVGHAVGHTLFYGQGAGQMPTASAVVSDLLNIAAGWYGPAFGSMHLTPDLHAPPRLVAPDDIESRWYLRLSALDEPNVMAQFTRALGEQGISLSAVLQHEQHVGQHVPVVITTHHAKWGDVRQAMQRLGELPVIDGEPVAIRIVDLPDDSAA